LDFLKKLANSSPVPAGGAAAAYTFSLGVGLIYKTLLTQMKKSDDPEMETNFMGARKELERLLSVSERLVKADSESYTNFARSLREGNKAEITQNFSRIIDTSMEIMEKSEAAFEWIRQLHQFVPPQMFTHLLVASELLMGAVNATVHVVRANLESVTNEKKKKNYFKKLNELHQTYQQKHRSLMENINPSVPPSS
jgi:formiminotetrahydrofolate cyclodeaminase